MVLSRLFSRKIFVENKKRYLQKVEKYVTISEQKGSDGVKLTVIEETIIGEGSHGRRLMTESANVSFDCVPTAGSRFWVGKAEFLVSSVKEDILSLTRLLSTGEHSKQIKVEAGKMRLYRPVTQGSGCLYRFFYTE